MSGNARPETFVRVADGASSKCRWRTGRTLPDAALVASAAQHNARLLVQSNGKYEGLSAVIEQGAQGSSADRSLVRS